MAEGSEKQEGETYEQYVIRRSVRLIERMKEPVPAAPEVDGEFERCRIDTYPRPLV